MPIVSFDQLPDSARLWVFASDRELTGDSASAVLDAVDDFLSGWKAHGSPLVCARDWRDNRFLAIGVDVNAENASGCSIDGLFRALQHLERSIGSRLVGGGRVFYRTDAGIEATTRDQFIERVQRGEVSKSTPVFDIGLSAAAGWRTRFEQPADKLFRVDRWTGGQVGS
jgi:hypothetical protein